MTRPDQDEDDNLESAEQELGSTGSIKFGPDFPAFGSGDDFCAEQLPTTILTMDTNAGKWAYIDQCLDAIIGEVHTPMARRGWWSSSAARLDYMQKVKASDDGNPDAAPEPDLCWDYTGIWKDTTANQAPLVPPSSGRRVPEALMLIVTELAEAMEGFRKGEADDHLPHHPSLTVELADAVIRIFDLAGGLNLNLAKAIGQKMQYNLSREDHSPQSRSASGGKSC